MSSAVVKTTEQKIKERKEKRRLKGERFLAKLERIERAKETEPKIETVAAVKGRQYTISIALPSSVIDNCLTLDLKCFVASMVGRCCAIFGIDEVVIFDDSSVVVNTTPGSGLKNSKHSMGAAEMLQYIECPPYLRKNFFPYRKDLENAVEMNPIDIPHHAQKLVSFREGIVTGRQVKAGQGSYVNVGLQRDVQVDRLLEEGVRVTVKMTERKEGENKLRGTVVSPQVPQLEHSLYWGYSVRVAKSFQEIFNGTYKYDLTIGTSDSGKSIYEAELKPFKHLLIVFSGAKSLESIMESEESMKESDLSKLFNLCLNTCPDQGSRTVRTEENLFITLSSIQCKLPAVE